MLTVSFIRGN